jgi:putative transcriptional regulator
VTVAIAVRLDDLLHDRRMTLTELAERVDITLANLSILKTGKARAIRFSTLEAICETLGCQPGDLLEFVPEAAADEQPRARTKVRITASQPLIEKPASR